MIQEIQKTTDFIEEKLKSKPKIALILGSGLGDFANSLENKITLPYQDIPNFPQSTVEGHKGQLVSGTVGGVALLVFQGRFHFYEGYTLEQTTYPVRVLKKLGIKTLIVTNAAGGINTTFKPGDFMALKDHLNLMGHNPLRGKNLKEFGPRFVDMTHPYNVELRSLAQESAKETGLTLHEGVYAAVTGPTYETPAEVKMLKTIGADAVGMSTVPEVIVARHQGLKVFAVSCISNMAACPESHSVNHQEVLDTTAKVEKTFGLFMKSLVIKISNG